MVDQSTLDLLDKIAFQGKDAYVLTVQRIGVMLDIGDYSTEDINAGILGACIFTYGLYQTNALEQVVRTGTKEGPGVVKGLWEKIMKWVK